MKYFIDTEFHEYHKQVKCCGIKINKPIPTIDLISIGIVAEDGREYYAISKDFNLKEAWNRYDLKEANTSDNHTINDIKVYWLRDNVLTSIWNELMLHHTSEDWYHTNIHFGNKVYNSKKLKFNYKSLKWLINKYGKTNKQIAEEIIEFCKPKLITEKVIDRKFYYTEESYADAKQRLEKGESVKLTEHFTGKSSIIQFYGYYSDYDWVVFCQLFGKMINLPKGFPMYCIDLKQTLDEKANNLTSFELSKLAHSGIIKHNVYSTYDSGVLKCSKTDLLKNALNYPKQNNEHNALADARWNKDLYNFLINI